MYKTIKSTLIILLLTVGHSYGQNDFRKGFVITLDNDTIQGQVDYSNSSKNPKSCLFQGEEGKFDYSPNLILGFGYQDDKFFSSQIIEDAFVEVLLVGEISLYKSEEKFHVKKDTSVFDLESKKVEVVKDGKVGYRETSKWRGIVNYLVSDCSTKGVANLKLDERSLTEFFLKYNKCKGTGYTEFKTSKPWTKVDLGVSLGVSLSRIQLTSLGSYFYLDESYSSVDPTFGIITTISSPRVSDKLTFQAELNFRKSNYSSTFKDGGANPKFYYPSIDLTTLSIPLSFNYLFPSKNYSLYINGGLNLDLQLNSSTKLPSEQVFDDEVITLPESTFWRIRPFQFGLVGGIGMLRSFKKFKGSVVVRYFQMSPIYREGAISMVVNPSRISLTLIVFKR
ncbi:MAG: porin family protein [Ekhidna sp.]